jgi:hypothetical protein
MSCKYWYKSGRSYSTGGDSGPRFAGQVLVVVDMVGPLRACGNGSRSVAKPSGSYSMGNPDVGEEWSRMATRAEELDKRATSV